MLSISAKTPSISILSVVVILVHLSACSTEKDIGSDSATSAGTTVAGTGTTITNTNPETDDISTTTPVIDTVTPTPLAPGALLSWVAPSSREDNTPISMAEIAGYRIYYGSAQGDYRDQIEINDAYANSVDPSDLGIQSGSYYMVITTVDTDGRESVFSAEVAVTI